MTTVHINLADAHDLSFEDLRVLLNSASDVVLEVPCTEVGNSNSNLSIAYEYLDAAFVGETLAHLCKQIRVEERAVSNHFGHHVCFDLQPNDVDGLARKLTWLAPIYGGDYSWDDDVYEEVRNDIIEFGDELGSKVLQFPELADNYMANLIAGEYDIDVDEVRNLHQRFPERRFRFWRSCASNCVGFDFYVSTFAWIIPHDVCVEDLLIRYGGFKDGLPELKKAEIFAESSVGRMVHNSVSIVYYPEHTLELARRAAEAIWVDPENEDPFDLQRTVREIRLSEEGNILVLTDNLATYIAFADELFRLPPTDEGAYLDVAAGAVERLRDLLAEPINITCPWDTLSDEQFEQLCYDVICHLSNYDSGRTRKLGKSRSRDGGRDIETYSRERIGKPSVKWLIQSKLLRPDRSLGARNLQISDVVDQYKAGGFGIMTSGYIDSTLHDRMSEIGANRQIEMAEWSRLELERFLARHPNIRARYFPSLRPSSSGTT